MMSRRSAADACGNTRSTPSATFSRAVSQGSRLGAWNTMPRSGPAVATMRPSSTMPPSVTSVSPAAIDSTVDLPQPECPISEMNSPRAMSRLNWSTTVSGPRVVGIGLHDLVELHVLVRDSAPAWRFCASRTARGGGSRALSGVTSGSFTWRIAAARAIVADALQIGR